jgi:N4-gp56 family major capsid protein
MATTTQSTLSPQVQLWFNKAILATPEASYIHNKVADRYKLPRMMGGTMRMTRYTKLPSAQRLDGTGIDPAATLLPAVNLDVTPTFHGLFVRLEQTVVLQRNDRVLSAEAARLGQSMRQTEDELTRDVLESTASVLNCTGGTNCDKPTEITRSDIDRVTTVLRGNDAIFFEREVHGSNRFGSSPIRNAFFGLCHTDVIERLNNVVGYANSSQYPNPYAPMPSEEGAAGNIRFLVSSQGSVTPNASGIGGADVYNIFVLGKKAVGLCELDGYSTKFIYHPPRLNGPLELSHTAGYKLSWGARILQDLHVQNLRCTI